MCRCLRERAVIWYAVAFVGILLEWLLFKEELGIAYTSLFGTLLKAVGDAALILLPYWLLKPSWRWTALLPVWGIAVWGVANLAYFRFWNDLIPPASIAMGGNVDGNLMEYGAALLRWSDLLMIGVPCAVWVALWRIRPAASPAFTGRIKLMLAGVSLLVGVAGQMSYFKTTYAWRNAISSRSLGEGLTDHFAGGYTGQRQLYTYNGPVYYGVRFAVDAIDLLTGTITLSDEQRKEIAQFLSLYERHEEGDMINIEDRANGVNADSLNVVYIIVESLNSDMVGRKIGGVAVMPTLDSLARMEGTVVFDNVVSQIKASSSSDGHLLLMTGLLPPEKAAYSIMYGSHNAFPSLADALPSHNKYLLLADEGVCWNEGNTLRNFGLGEPLAIKDRPQYSPEKYGRDGAMFMQAAEMLDSIREPFFMTLMTISMHIPFKEEAWPLPKWLEDAEGLSRMERDYANMCSRTDSWIGAFIRKLPANTLTIIASDHHQDVASTDAGHARAFFMAVNSGRTERISRTIGQVNLFPATLDLLKNAFGGGLPAENMPYGAYHGLARSGFDESIDGTMDSYGNLYGKPSQGALDTLGRAYGISDLIIRGDYFRAIDR